MLIREMVFVFHKSKQALNMGDFKEISKDDKQYEDCLLFYSNEQWSQCRVGTHLPRCDTGRTIHAQLFRPHEMYRHESSVNP